MTKIEQTRTAKMPNVAASVGHYALLEEICLVLPEALRIDRVQTGSWMRGLIVEGMIF